MKRTLLILLLLASHRASAFESECTRDTGMSRDPATMEAAICRTRTSGADEMTCGDGIQFARGALLGEHTFLTHQAMQWTGIPAELLTDQDVLRYYGTGENVPGSGGVVSVAPAAPTRMRAAVTRPISIAEFAQALDGSYSLSDFLNGNEHCPVSEQTTGSFAELQQCHTFTSHLAVVNSTHFSPQNREMARRYHGMAQDTADRCLAMHDAFLQQAVGGIGHPLTNRTTKAVQQCIKEALAMEAIASHFLEDAWSTGHMWQRWGSPLFPDDKDYVRNHIAGLVSGIIHGWRSVARDSVYTRGDQHDQLCMPGPRDDNEITMGPWKSDEPGADATVTFTYPGGTAPPIPGGGDCYVLPCSARENDEVELDSIDPNPRWALWFDKNSNQQSPLYAQRLRLMTCLRRGFEELYARLPPIYGALTPSVDEVALDQAVTKADGMMSDLCWNQRVTNRSLLLAGKFGEMSADLWDPGIMSHINLSVGVWKATTLSPDDEARQGAIVAQRDNIKTEVRAELVARAAYVALRARYGANDTDLAELASEKFMSSQAGVRRNSEGAMLIASDNVPYLEKADRFLWVNERFGPCNKDQDCRASAQEPRSYCDPGALVTDNASEPGCVSYDTAVTRAFREGETIHWCGVQDLIDVNAARRECKLAGPTSGQCKACVELVVPRLRNGCEPSAEGFVAKPAAGGDNRSMCDLLVDATEASGTPRIPNLTTSPRIYWPYEVQDGEGVQAARDRAALEACLNGDDGADGKTAIASYGYIPAPPATGDAFPFVSRMISAGTCGQSETPTHWYRLTASEVANYRVRLQTTKSNSLGIQPPQKLKLDVFGGPACDASSPPITSGAPVDENANGEADYLESMINIPALPYEVCIRVTGVDRTTRTTWRLTIDRFF